MIGFEGNNLPVPIPPVDNSSGMLRAENVLMLERRYKVLALRRDGYTYPEIANLLEVSLNTVRRDLEAVMGNIASELTETAEEARQLIVERLDKLLKTYMPFATEFHSEAKVMDNGKEVIVEVPPDPVYAALVLKIEDNRARLLALNMPETKKLEVSGIREYIGVDIEKV